MASLNRIPQTDVRAVDIRDTLNAHGGTCNNFLPTFFTDGSADFAYRPAESMSGVCQTASSASSKSVTIGGADVSSGHIVCVRFSHVPSSRTFTLSVSNGQSTVSRSVSSLPSDMYTAYWYTFLNDGSHWRCVGYRNATYRPNAGINKWSKGKPVSYDSVAPLSAAQMAAARYGLTAGHITFSQGRMVGESEWSYTVPSGGERSPMRLSDFRGYNPEAEPPFKALAQYVDWNYADGDADPTVNFTCGWEYHSQHPNMEIPFGQVLSPVQCRLAAWNTLLNNFSGAPAVFAKTSYLGSVIGEAFSFKDDIPARTGDTWWYDEPTKYPFHFLLSGSDSTYYNLPRPVTVDLYRFWLSPLKLDLSGGGFVEIRGRANLHPSQGTPSEVWNGYDSNGKWQNWSTGHYWAGFADIEFVAPGGLRNNVASIEIEGHTVHANPTGSGTMSLARTSASDDGNLTYMELWWEGHDETRTRFTYPKAYCWRAGDNSRVYTLNLPHIASSGENIHSQYSVPVYSYSNGTWSYRGLDAFHNNGTDWIANTNTRIVSGVAHIGTGGGSGYDYARYPAGDLMAESGDFQTQGTFLHFLSHAGEHGSHSGKGFGYVASESNYSKPVSDTIESTGNADANICLRYVGEYKPPIMVEYGGENPRLMVRYVYGNHDYVVIQGNFKNH